MIAHFGHADDYKLTSEISDRLRFWALLANDQGRYSQGPLKRCFAMTDLFICASRG
jgi:hypothetical protein